MKKVIIIIIVSIIFSVVFFISIGFIFVHYFSDYQRYSIEQKAKYDAWADIMMAANHYKEKNDLFPKSLSVITNNVEWQKYYKMMRQKYCKEDFLKDFYYIPHSNWYEVGYFIALPGKKKAYVKYGVYLKSPDTEWVHAGSNIDLNANGFYKTNEIFHEGLFEKQKNNSP